MSSFPTTGGQRSTSDDTDTAGGGQNSGVEREPPPIAPIDFVPAQNASVPRRLPGLFPLLLLCALVLIGLALWFLITARAVTIVVDPPNANIDISGGPSLSLSEHVLLRPGAYQLHISAEGYRPVEIALQVSKADRQQHQIELEILPGHLEIKTVPPNASVILDGSEQGTTPLTINDLEAGRHDLEIRAERYLPVTEQIDIEGRDQIQAHEYQLAPAWGFLELATVPSGAAIFVGEVEHGATPAEVPVLASGETVELRLPGYKTWSRELSVPVGERQAYPVVTFSPADGELTLSSVPAGARITVDGQFVGVTPAVVALAPDKKHQLSLFLDGYARASRQLTLTSGEQKRLEIPLQARMSAVNVTAKPAQATIYVDGDYRGSAPLKLSLLARPTRIEARAEGYVSVVRELTPKPDVEQSLHFSLQTQTQARLAKIPASTTSSAGHQLKLFRPNTQFTMGASRRQRGRQANEILRDVRLKRPFYLATTEVTNRQFRQFRAGHSSKHADGNTLDTREQPVVNVDWQAAALYCNWLSAQEKLEPFYVVTGGAVTGVNENSMGYRLPTEAEWVWAARWQPGGAMLKYPWGDELIPKGKVANVADRSAADIVRRSLPGYDDGYVVSAPVARFPANAKGLYDLAGNVAEWVHDYYSIAATLSPAAQTDPLGPDTGQFRVIRGSSWRHGGVTELRLSYRDYGDKPRDDLGFRVARYAE